jgi:hypothetical protein
VLQRQQQELIIKIIKYGPCPHCGFAVAPKKTGCEGVDWIDLFQGRDQWQAFVNMVMSPLVKQKAGNIWTS